MSTYIYSKKDNQLSDGTACHESCKVWEDGKEVVEGKDYFMTTSPFVAGNYMNKCCNCGKQFKGADKLWFLCQDCCNEPFAYPLTTQSESEDELLILLNKTIAQGKELIQYLENKKQSRKQ